MNTFENVLQTVRKAKQELGEILSSCEYIDAETMNCVVDNLQLKRVIPKFPFYMLLECSGSNESHDKDKLNAFLENIMETGIVSDGTVAADSNQMMVSIIQKSKYFMPYYLRVN